MPQPAPQPDHVTCQFQTVMAAILPFYIRAAHGDAAMVEQAALELLRTYQVSNAVELDLVGRLITFSAAAMDNLRISARPGLSDRNVIEYRCNAVALSRSADQCFKVLEAVRAKPQACNGVACGFDPTWIAAPTAFVPPVPAPQPVSPPPPAAPRPQGPPAPSRPPFPQGAAQAPAAARDHVTADRASIAASMPTDPAFATSVEEMKRNLRIVLGDLHLNGRRPDHAATRPKAQPARAKPASKLLRTHRPPADAKRPPASG